MAKRNIDRSKLVKISNSQITSEKIYNNRRKFIQQLGLTTSAFYFAPASIGKANDTSKLTDYNYVTTYNNYYEFGTDKSDPAKYAKNFISDPWTITLDGEVEKKVTLSMDEIKKMFPSEERVYRLRCVEGWSMVIPWLGFPLNKLLNKASPNSKAKYVKFETILDPEQMRGQKYPILNWPYKEGLRIDEAMHPLTIMVTGLYGKELPNQNGSPIRLMVPWKYGFKSAKAIVRISFLEKMPRSSWMEASPREYGFYSNVNPNVDHPRWSQATERVIGESIFAPRIPTLMFNGYEEEVSHLYKDMDLRKYY